MSYSLLWWNLAMLGVGMGLVMTPMTAAVMSAVPRARAGMASATTNASARSAACSASRCWAPS